MDNSEDTQGTSQPDHRTLRARRFSTAVVGAAALVALSVGAALAATSDEEPTAEPSAGISVPADGDTGVSGGGDTTGGSDPSPSPTFTEPDDPTEEPTEGPTDGPSAPSELDELNRRISELDKKVDELPTKKELADALRAFADELDKNDPSGES
ncbi:MULTISPECIES: hypothetical protein [unclassified Streptomyces]|uniref:hypothetical protein n=1 Tax=unclassified Streptomyces TaxID=2593676 RepID=UPI002251F3AA|nr:MULTISPECIES: hypothetical protein [unclassified Streptomyces]MCX5333179.1 hypothetical protein [Streptomyces sp. NBC_00140]MCX5362597.1 hypothetical protein [Streptomyces sp. NBC_00124]